MISNAPLAIDEREDTDDWSDFSSFQGANGEVREEKATLPQSETSSSIGALSTSSFKVSGDSLEDLVSSFDKVVAKCLRTSISLDGIVPTPRIRHLDDLVEEECGNSYFSAFLTPNYLERLASVRWSESKTNSLFTDSLNRTYHDTGSSEPSSPTKKKKVHIRTSRSSSFGGLSETSDTQSSENASDSQNDGGDLHALMVSSVVEADFNESHPIISADDVINEIDEMMRAQDEADIDATGFDCDSFYPAGASHEIAMIDEAGATVDSGYDISMTSSAFSTLPQDDAISNQNGLAKVKPLPLEGMHFCSGVSVNGKYVAESPQHSDDDVVQLYLPETLEEMSMIDLERHSERLQNAIRKYSDVLVEELASRDEQVDLKETRDNFVGLVMSVQRRVKDVTTPTSSAPTTPQSSLNNIALMNSDNGKKKGSPFVTTVIPFNPDNNVLGLDELRVLTKSIFLFHFYFIQYHFYSFSTSSNVR